MLVSQMIEQQPHSQRQQWTEAFESLVANGPGMQHDIPGRSASRNLAQVSKFRDAVRKFLITVRGMRQVM